MHSEIITTDARHDAGISLASYNLGCFFGSILTIWLGNPLGRKRMIMLGAFVMILGAILQVSSFGLPQLIVARITAGLGNGANTSTVSDRLRISS